MPNYYPYFLSGPDDTVYWDEAPANHHWSCTRGPGRRGKNRDNLRWPWWSHRRQTKKGICNEADKSPRRPILVPQASVFALPRPFHPLPGMTPSLLRLRMQDCGFHLKNRCQYLPFVTIYYLRLTTIYLVPDAEFCGFCCRMLSSWLSSSGQWWAIPFLYLPHTRFMALKVVGWGPCRI